MMEWLWRTWLARDEYRLFDDDARWRAALLTARRQISNHWAFWLFWFPIAPGILGLGLRLRDWLARSSPSLRPFAPYCAAVTALGVLSAVVGVVWYGCSRVVRRHLRVALWAEGRRICTRCGYDLRGQVVPRCPECGQSLEDSAEDLRAKPGPLWHAFAWLWGRVLARPEYASLAGNSEWVTVLKRAHVDAVNHWSVWLACGLVFVIYCSGLGPMAVIAVLMPWLPLGWVLVLSQLLPAALTVAATVLIVRRRVRRALRSMLDRPAQ